MTKLFFKHYLIFSMKISDPMGQAILDYHRNGKAARLRVFSPQFDEDEMPLETLFRSYNDMPHIERGVKNATACDFYHYLCQLKDCQQ